MRRREAKKQEVCRKEVERNAWPASRRIVGDIIENTSFGVSVKKNNNSKNQKHYLLDNF